METEYLIVEDTDVAELIEASEDAEMEVRCAWCQDASGENVTSTICASCEALYFGGRAA